jgi:putative aminopeptidase FrvX
MSSCASTRSPAIKDDLKRLGIDIGDTIAIDPHPEFLDNGFIVSRHLDDKAGVAVMFAAIEALATARGGNAGRHPFLFTIAEEVGSRRLLVLHP